MATSIRIMEKMACFDGEVTRFSHVSQACNERMRCMVYSPPQAKTGRVPGLYFLAGLTCSEETFLAKSGVI
ncbi:MAG: S-formylglutathione hydrolase, partial [Pseudomonadota bacterium]|nr:S-formylglutathione hydrolase [Pseudomonadota bacterium]